MASSDRGAYERWVDTNRQLHRANLAFADGVGQCLPESHLLALARDVGQLAEFELGGGLKTHRDWRGRVKVRSFRASRLAPA